MKKILSILMLSVMLCICTGGQSVNLAWNPSCDPNVVGYNLYWGQQNTLTTNVMAAYDDGCGNLIPAATNIYHVTYTNVIVLGNVTNATVTNLVSGKKYFFAATSRDAAGIESPYSNEAQYTIPPPSVKGLIVTP